MREEKARGRRGWIGLPDETMGIGMREEGGRSVHLVDGRTSHVSPQSLCSSLACRSVGRGVEEAVRGDCDIEHAGTSSRRRPGGVKDKGNLAGEFRISNYHL